jgi:hypothetical protein
MSEINPYASPASIDPRVVPAVLAEAAVGGGLWRKGNLLVMHKRAVLPDRCVKSNRPAHGRRLRRRLYWHHPVVFLALVLNVLIYIALALALRKTATIDIGLSKEWFAKRRRAIIVGWTLVLVSVMAVVLGLVSIHRIPLSGLLIPSGVALFLGGAIFGLIAARMVAPQRITDHYVWLKGVHRDFLNELPDWPYSP